MADDLQSMVPPRVSAPQHHVPPTARELRGQAVHRLQVGLLGLCTMLLLVGLANIIMDRARQADQSIPAAEPVVVPQPVKPATNPLVDMGVAPAVDPSAAPDVEPDPTFIPGTGQ